MSARTHPSSPASAAGGVDVRLPWWAVALPVVAFVVLLVVMTGTGEAHAATADPAVGAFLDRIHQTLAR